ncbi:RNA polymerase sigma factor SigF [soil metagenome]
MNSAPTNSVVTTKTEALLKQAKGASAFERQHIENAVVELNLDLARALASRYVGRGADRDDLVQVACVGLVKAARRYDPEKGNFGSFAVPTILGEIKRYFRDHGWMVRPPRRIQELQASITAASEKGLRETAQAPSADELSHQLDTPVRDIREALSVRGCFTPTSLDAELSPDGRTVGDSLGVEELSFEAIEGLATISSCCRELPEDDRRLLALRFFDDRTQQDIADELGITQMQVSRRLKRILATLRSAALSESEAA